MKWFAERVDRIILLFDAHKLDISDEFKNAIEALNGHDEKIRILLNKSDMISQQQLMRVYGALMWSLSKVLLKPEVARVYIGSFWDKPLIFDTNKRLFEEEERDLITDLQSLPKDATLRRLNDLIKRARMARVHSYIISQLRYEMPSVFGKEKKKLKLIEDLEGVYDRVEKLYDIPRGDFPDITSMRKSLFNKDFTKFSKLKPGLIKAVDNMIGSDVPALMDLISRENLKSKDNTVKGKICFLTKIYPQRDP